ncbi:threonine ammonia-lyase [Dactylosporangium salmoneum]|uniref:Tryptophan synthase beta chain-like PALP domain-containing protein n=1 Tax=Dactylosporangium salmoneum TaxID=53361 RepID=A0ABN3H5G0_9ACTN
MLTMRDVLRARRLIRDHLPPTPSWSYPLLDEAAGRHLVVKHENAQPTGAFKVRGALNLLAGLDEPVVTYSTGNHARAIAYAARAFGRHATVVMPEHAAELKVRAVEALGAAVVRHGANMGDAEAHAQTLPGRLVSPGDEPALIAGVATAYLELFERHPGLDTVVVPVGSGTGAAAAGLVAAAVAPGCRVIGVQSAAAPAAHDSWRAGHCVRRENRTRVDGLATGRGFEGPQALLRAHLADFVLVGDDEIDAARRLLARRAGTQAEGAGAAALAAVLARPDLMGRAVGVVVTGANATELELAR